MITLSFDNTQVHIPQSWSDIRLADYERWFRIEPQTRIEQISLVANICGIDPDFLLNSPTQLFDTVVDIVQFVFAEYQGKANNCIEIDGFAYSIAYTDELTLGEWVDIEALFDSDSPSHLSDILSILCRPLGEHYDSKTSDARKHLFADLAMDKVLPLLAFFLQQREQLQNASNLYLEVSQAANQYLLLTRSFVENGDGIKLLPIWQRIRYYFLMKFLKKQLSKCLAFSSIE